MSDSPDGVIFLDNDNHEWAYMCAHCDKNVHYNGRQEAFVWRELVEHLVMTHGLRRTWVECVDDRIAQMRQVALPLIFNQHQKARSERYRYEG